MEKRFLLKDCLLVHGLVTVEAENESVAIARAESGDFQVWDCAQSGVYEGFQYQEILDDDFVDPLYPPAG